MAKKKKDAGDCGCDNVATPPLLQIPSGSWTELVGTLIRLGWLVWSKRTAPPDERVLDAVMDYQSWAGLKVDGIAGAVTLHSLRQPRLCGTPDHLQVAGDPCKWPHRQITWSILSQLPGVRPSEFHDAVLWAIGRWAAVCNLQPVVVEGRANITVTTANLGGPGNVLADSQLPCGVDSRATLRQRYDTSELWFAGQGRPPSGRLSLRGVVLHELGHAIGIDHLPPDGATGIMQPYYRDDVIDLLLPDIEQAVRRYGPVTNDPPPSPPLPPPAVGQAYVLRFTSAVEPVLERVAA